MRRQTMTDRGATAIEYALLTALVGVVLIVGVAFVGSRLSTTFTAASGPLTGATAQETLADGAAESEDDADAQAEGDAQADEDAQAAETGEGRGGREGRRGEGGELREAEEAKAADSERPRNGRRLRRTRKPRRRRPLRRRRPASRTRSARGSPRRPRRRPRTPRRRPRRRPRTKSRTRPRRPRGSRGPKTRWSCPEEVDLPQGPASSPSRADRDPPATGHEKARSFRSGLGDPDRARTGDLRRDRAAR